MPDLSPAQKKYLACVRREKYLIHVSRIFLFLGFLLLWEVSARQGWIDSFIFSSPSEIWRTFFKMVQDQSLFTHIGITLMETLVSFVFTVFLGIGTAVLLWCCPKLSRILEPYLVVLNSLPKSALAPLLIVWLGANIRTIMSQECLWRSLARSSISTLASAKLTQRNSSSSAPSAAQKKTN